MLPAEFTKSKFLDQQPAPTEAELFVDGHRLASPRTALQVVIVNCSFSMGDNCEIAIITKNTSFNIERYVLSYVQMCAADSLCALYKSRK